MALIFASALGYGFQLKMGYYDNVDKQDEINEQELKENEVPLLN
jgi:hypothetical protein